MRTRAALSRGRQWVLHLPRSRLVISAAAMSLAGSLTAYSALAVTGHRAAAAADASGSLTAAAGCAAPGQASSAGAQRTAGPCAGSPAAARQAQVPADATVTLLTGDQVTLTGGDGVSVTPAGVPGKTAKSAPAMYVHFAVGGDQYVVPAAAVPYLGSALDPRLFDVSYLARAGLDDAHSKTLPLEITYAGRLPSLPGVRVTHTSAGTAAATLTTAQAPGLGRLLATQWRASVTGHRPVVAGTLPGITRISLAQPPGGPALPAPPPQSPGQPSGPAAGPVTGGAPHYHTLTLNFTGPGGQPATAVGFVQNVSDEPLGTFMVPYASFDPLAGTSSSASFSVPDGTYSIEVAVLTPHPGADPNGIDGALVVKPQVTVNSDQTVTLDARTAVPFSASVAGVTPTEQAEELSFTRTSATGGGLTTAGSQLPFSLIASLHDAQYTGSALSATPTTPVTTGTAGFDAESQLYPNGSQSDPASFFPGYYLEFPHTGSIPASLTYTVANQDLTTVHEHVYDNPASTASTTGCPPNHFPGLIPGVFYPWGYRDGGVYQFNTGDFQSIGWPGAPIRVQPGDSTEYWYTSDPSLTTWRESFNPCDEAFTAAPQRIRPGEQITQTWGQDPLVPEPTGADADVTIKPPPVTVCPACRQDNNFIPSIWPDNDQYNGANDLSWAFYQNNRLVVEQPSGPPGLPPYLYQAATFDLPLLPEQASYRLDLAIRKADYDPGASTETDWTFRSGPSDPAATLPAYEECGPDPSRSCSFLPLLFINYNLPLNDNNQAAAGQPFQVAFTVAHQPGQTAPAGVTATVSASFDDGKTWTAPQPATSQSSNQFTATIAQPPLADTSGWASLRITATDAAGNSVTQTAIEAYQLIS
jgi:hypothetical protein